jgi:LuxR family transcriptional regulator, maltose regulon positive regulatory protein
VGLGEVAYQRNELDTALQHVTEGIALCRRFVYTASLATGLATLAWIRQATGDPAGALEAMGEAELAAPGPASLLNPVPAQRARLLLAHGRPDQARELLERLQALAVARPTAPRRPPAPRELGLLR